MQRHFSDPNMATNQRHAPQRPSRLNPALNGRRGSDPPAALQGRGTVSMPTSPLRRAVDYSWNEPHSAQDMFGYAGKDDYNMAPDLFASPFSTRQNLPNIDAEPDPFHLTGAALPAYGSTGVFGLAGSDSHSLDRGLSAEAVDDLGRQPQWSQHGDATSPLSARPDSGGHYGSQHGEEHRHGFAGNMDEEEREDEPGTDMNGQQRMRKKRQQVRVACTHCQKACKKCSNTRPCERCVKYNLADCVDSTRKPRKTGVKRGPYKRRSSKAYLHSTSISSVNELRSQHFGSSSSPPHQHSSDLLHNYQLPQLPQDYPAAMGYNDRGQSVIPPELGHHYQSQLELRQEKAMYEQEHRLLLRQRQQQRQRQNSLGHLQHHDAFPPRRQQFQQVPYRPSNDDHSRNTSWSTQDSQSHPFPPQPPSPTLPAPRASQLESALSVALSGLGAQPRWVDGQRVLDLQAQGAGTLMPHTPTVPFPMSLRRSARDADPFSRAVSPIRGLHAGGQEEQTVKKASFPGGLIPQHPPGYTGTPHPYGSTPDVKPVHVEYQQPSSAGQDTSMTMAHTALPAVSQPGSPHPLSSQDTSSPFSTSDIPGSSALQPQSQASAAGWNAWNTASTGSPTTIALKRIRRPSLRTLIMPGISRAGSPVNSPTIGPGPVSGTWSPGLAMTNEQHERIIGSGAVGGVGGTRDGTMSPTLYQGDLDGAEELTWSFGAAQTMAG